MTIGRLGIVGLSDTAGKLRAVGTEGEGTDREAGLDERLRESKGIADRLHESRAGVLEPHATLHIGFDRGHRDRLRASLHPGPPQARDSVVEIERRRNIDKRPVSHTAPTDCDPD